MSYKLMVMSFDGENVKEGEFDTIQNAWEYSNNMGSRWYFYPFHFVVSASGQTISAAPYGLEFFKNKRVKTVRAIFEQTSKLPELANADCDLFALALQDLN